MDSLQRAGPDLEAPEGQVRRDECHNADQHHEHDEASPEGCGTPLTHTRLEAFILLVL